MAAKADHMTKEGRVRSGFSPMAGRGVELALVSRTSVEPDRRQDGGRTDGQ